MWSFFLSDALGAGTTGVGLIEGIAGTTEALAREFPEKVLDSGAELVRPRRCFGTVLALAAAFLLGNLVLGPAGPGQHQAAGP